MQAVVTHTEEVATVRRGVLPSLRAAQPTAGASGARQKGQADCRFRQIERARMLLPRVDLGSICAWSLLPQSFVTGVVQGEKIDTEMAALQLV